MRPSEPFSPRLSSTRRFPTTLAAAFFVATGLPLVACDDTSDTSETGDTGDTNNTDDTNDTDDTNNTDDTSDTSDTNDTGDTSDTNDTSDTGDTPFPAKPIVVTTALSSTWKRLPHRLSRYVNTFIPDADARGGTLIAQNDGGPFGAFDEATATQTYLTVTSDFVASRDTAVELIIGPTSSTNPADPTAFVASGFATFDLADESGIALPANARLVAFIRGYRIHTDRYETPPPFETEIPYDPADGFTVQGLGIQLGDPTREGPVVTLPVAGRVSLGTADRADMNSAIKDALVWLTVDVQLVALAASASPVVTRGEASYFLNNPTYGKNTVHAVATPDQKRITVTSSPDAQAAASSAFIGITGFDIWLNVADKIDPACLVIQPELNFEGEPVAGPGRYITDIGIAAALVTHDPDTRTTEAAFDLYLSNRSEFSEEGNLCLGMRGELAVVHLADPAAEVAPHGPYSLKLTNLLDETFTGEPEEQPVRFE